MKKLTLLTAAVALIAVAAVQAQDKPAPKKHEGRHPVMEQLLPPPLVEKLNLTADQKAKLDELNASFKKDEEAWKAEHPNFAEEVKKAREAKDKEAMQKLMAERKPLFEKRKGYVEQFKASLTDEQKNTLAERMKGRAQGGPGHHKPAEQK